MNILFIGDVTGQVGCDYLAKVLPGIKHKHNVDMVICNGENSADGNGITPKSASFLLNHGVDVITTGNHAFKRPEMSEVFQSSDVIIRPINYGEECIGHGVCEYDFGSFSVAVVNLMGVVYMENLDNPFNTMDRLLSEIKTPNIIVDFHAEATAEKKAMGYYLAGRVSAVLGTHTHVQTADESIIEGHTGYITDVGMTGPIESVLGVKKEIAIERMKTHFPSRFEIAPAPCEMDSVLLTIDNKSGKCTGILRIKEMK